LLHVTGYPVDHAAGRLVHVMNSAQFGSMLCCIGMGFRQVLEIVQIGSSGYPTTRNQHRGHLGVRWKWTVGKEQNLVTYTTFESSLPVWLNACPLPFAAEKIPRHMWDHWRRDHNVAMIITGAISAWYKWAHVFSSLVLFIIAYSYCCRMRAVSSLSQRTTPHRCCQRHMTCKGLGVQQHTSACEMADVEYSHKYSAEASPGKTKIPYY